jgi:hypothetical protein
MIPSPIGGSCPVCGEQYAHREDCELKPKSVAEYMAGKRCKGFKPTPFYSVDGDMIEVYFKDDLAYAQPLADGVVALRSQATGEIVGMKIHGVKQLIAEVSE